jgi:arsenate reductase
MKKTVFALFLAVLLLAGCSPARKDKPASEAVNKPGAVETSDPDKSSKSKSNKNTMYPKLSIYIESVLTGMDAIPQDRQDQLKAIARFVQDKKKSNAPANLTFICTHNSRRSHMSQIWAATAAAYYGFEEVVHTYSGGTEATAFNPRAVAAIGRAGFKVENPGGDNPNYKVTYSENGQMMECFSKKYDDPYNARENFVAVMTCSDADRNCPFIPGADLRIPIPYLDPKASDGTAQEAATYDERCKQIATEMFYLMSQVRA